jgi:hypothetical protein
MRATNGQRQCTVPVPLCFTLLGLFCCSGTSLAESHENVEVKPFGVIDTGATFSIRYLLDENDRSSDSSSSTFEHRTTWEQELFLISETYVYHPGFLNMEFGGGPLLVQQDFKSDVGEAKSNETLFNFLARFNFLDLKSYPFSFYFQRSHPSLATSLSGRFLTRTDEYGFRGRSTGLVKATDLFVDLSSRTTEGSGFGTVVDDDMDRAFFRWNTGYGDDARITFEHDQYTQNSLSGSTGLPIQESSIEQSTTSLKARNFFGANRQFLLNQILIGLDQETESASPSELESLYYSANANWQNSESIRSSGRYGFYEIKREGADSKTHDLAAAMNHSIREDLNYDLSADHRKETQTGFASQRTGIGGGVNFWKSLGIGSLGLSGALRHERNDQESSSDTIQVFDEALILVGTTPVDLANEFVVTSSVVVTNSAGTQVFVEDVDYRLVFVGSVTSVQRLIDGNIFDGQTVLVDYEYLTSGTAKFDRFGANASATLDFLKYGRALLRFTKTDTTLVSGQLTTPINDSETLEFALGADFPIGDRWRVGGEFRHVDRNEDIAPSVRDSVAVNASTRVFGSMNLYASANLIHVDQEESIEDVDQAHYRLGIRGIPFGRAQLVYEASYLEDTGGSLPREQIRHRLTLQGGYRMVRYMFRVIVSDETLGDTERDYTQITATVMRDF